MDETIHSARAVRFGTFEVDLRTGEVRKAGVRLKLTGQAFQVLAILLERPGEIVRREELQNRLWPDTFVDGNHNLNTAINKVREVLGDSAENPRFVETLPKRGYRFIGTVEVANPPPEPASAPIPTPAPPTSTGSEPRDRSRLLLPLALFAAFLLIAGASVFLYMRRRAPVPPPHRLLTRLTFDEGLQVGASWSPDGRFIAYSSNRGGKFDIWVQQVSGGDPVRITKEPGQNWQPDWSPDGKYIAYRSEEGEGGIFIVPALGGSGMERKIASFGYYPRWSPDSSRILFQTTQFGWLNRLYVVGLEGAQPREVLTQLAANRRVRAMSAAWHPDGKRITGLINSGPMPSFWTGLVEGGQAVNTRIPAELEQQIKEVSADQGMRIYEHEWVLDFKFAWAPSGTAIYFERTFRGARNIWRMTVDPQTLGAISIERVTTGPGLDTEFSLSPDGKRLAFTAESAHVRAWLFPFDAAHGKVTGAGRPITSSGADAWLHSLSRDGKRLVFSSARSGNWVLTESSVPDGTESPVVSNDHYQRDYAQWSPDSSRMAYARRNDATGEGQIVEWSTQARTEEPLTQPSRADPKVFDWSARSDTLLASQNNAKSDTTEIVRVSATSGGHSEAAVRTIVSSPEFDVYQAQFSPDERWIVFEALPTGASGWSGSAIFVSPASGGPWVRLTDGKRWDDKPRWSPDGKTIYFVSGRSGFYDVWGIHFDPAVGKAVGEPFRVTELDNPSQMVPKFIPTVSLSLTQDRLVLTVAQVSGSIWVLDHVEP